MESKHIPTELLAFRIANKGDYRKTPFTSIPDGILICKTFYDKNLVGSFFSCIYNGNLRIHLVFNEENEHFYESIIELITQSMNKAGIAQGQIWFKSKNKRLISVIGDKFQLELDSEQFFYHSTEYIMRRESFNKRFDNTVLEAKPYEETHIDKYLELLNDAMSFFIPPEDFVNEKARYLKKFKDFKEKNAFEAFWKDGKLVGLYWLDGIEVDTMGVSSDFQRLGYGSMILTKAIETIFQQNPDIEYAILYAVGWNAKAQNFYKKYGMEVNGQYQVPYVDNPTV